VRLSANPAKSTAVLSLPLGVLTAASVVGNVLAPHLLISNPLVLVMLAPRTLYLTVAAGRAPLGAFLVVGLLRLAAADPSHYLLGRLHGPRLTALARRTVGSGTHRMIDWALLAWQRIGLPLVALSPSGKFILLAGASGMRHRRVAGVALGGTLGQLLLLYAAGRVVAQPSQAVAALASDHATALVLVVAVATIVALVKAGWAGASVVSRFGQVAGPDEGVAVGLQDPRGALGHGGFVVPVEAELALDAGEQALDDVPVGAQHGHPAGASPGQGQDRLRRAALDQGGVDLDRQPAVAGHVHHRLRAPDEPAGQDALDPKGRQNLDQPGRLPPALGRERPELVGAGPLRPVAGMGVPDDQQRDGHRRPVTGGRKDLSTLRSRS
jgi:hypothetical protein